MTNEEHYEHDKLALLMITQSESEAGIVHGLLEESGIHSVLLTPVPHNLYPFTVDGLAASLFTPWVTSATQSLEPQPSFTTADGTFIYTIPSLSIITFDGVGRIRSLPGRR